MNKQKTAILCDTGCDIPQSLAKELHIHMIPLHIMYPEKDYLDDIDIDPLMVYERWPDEIPTTSTPSVQEIVDVYEGLKAEGYEHVIAIAISSKFSGSFNAMRIASGYVEDLEVFCFDTKNISCGSGLFGVWAAKKLAAGKSFKEVTKGLEKKLYDSHVFFYMDTLTYLEKGGRIGKVKSLVGEILHLKPIITCNREGVYTVAAKSRGLKAVQRALLDRVEGAAKGHKVWVAVMNGKAEEMMALTIEKLKSVISDMKIIYTRQITATLALNTGPGLVGVGLLEDP